MRFLKKKTSILLIAVSLFTGIKSLKAQTERFSFQKFISNGDTLNYRFLFPDSDTLRKYPLVVFLHGSGERGNDNKAQLQWGVQNFATDEAMSLRPAFVIAPQCPEKMQWSNTTRVPGTNDITLNSTPSKPMSLLIQLIHEAVGKFRIDVNRIYITGLSMGGFGTYDAIERYPDLFAAAVPVCGGGDTSKASLIAHIPMWIFHGADDPGVNPIYSINMVKAMNNAGAHPGLTLYPGVGHFSWLAAYSDKKMMEWLFMQHK